MTDSTPNADRRAHARAAAPGDLFALPETAGWPVEWLVVGPAPGAPGRLLAVPADGHPLAGSSDVAIPGAPGGPLTARCRLALTLAAASLPPERRSGLVGPAELAAVAARCAEVEAGGPEPDDEQEEVDSSPEYRRWIAETVAPARAALAAAPAPGAEVAAFAAGRSRPPARSPGRAPAIRRPTWTAHRLLPLAASVLVATSLALGGGVLVQSRRIERLAAESAATERRLAAEVGALAEARRGDADAHRREVESLQAEHAAALAAAGREAAPAPPPAARPLANLPFAWLRPEGDATRGEPQAIEVASGADLVALILPVDDPRGFDRFRLEVLRDATGRRVWATDELVLTGLAETSVALPDSLLPAGDYTLRLAGLGGAEPEPLAVYRLRIGGPPPG